MISAADQLAQMVKQAPDVARPYAPDPVPQLRTVAQVEASWAALVHALAQRDLVGQAECGICHAIAGPRGLTHTDHCPLDRLDAAIAALRVGRAS